MIPTLYNSGLYSKGTTSAGAGAGAGGWVELGRTTLGSAADVMSVTSLANKRYYKILVDQTHSSDQQGGVLTFNSDTGANYARRIQDNGAADSTATSQTSLILDHGGETNYGKFSIGYISNLSTKEKLAIVQNANTSTRAASTAPMRAESVGKWTNTSNAIDTMTVTNVGTGDFASGDELVVLGWDPADIHTDNFWEELASVSGDGTSTTLSSGTITAKKYLWTQLYTDESTNSVMRFNSDSGSNYARRGSVNGAADFTVTSATGSSNLPSSNEAFGNCFIINNSAKEKLGISNSIDQNTAGAANAPHRKEECIKWANTAAQITNISWVKTGNWSSKAILKVWGSD